MISYLIQAFFNLRSANDFLVVLLDTNYPE